MSGVRSSDEVMYWCVLLCIVAGVSGMALSLMTDYGLRFASRGVIQVSLDFLPIWVLLIGLGWHVRDCERISAHG